MVPNLCITSGRQITLERYIGKKVLETTPSSETYKKDKIFIIISFGNCGSRSVDIYTTRGPVHHYRLIWDFIPLHIFQRTAFRYFQFITMSFQIIEGVFSKAYQTSTGNNGQVLPTPFFPSIQNAS